jgi:ubiquinone biosynthesis protein
MMRDLGRMRRIAGVLTRNGFQDVAMRLGPVARMRALAYYLRRRPAPTPIPVAVRIRCVLEDLGPTFVKLGQMLATRPDLVPLDVAVELKHLHDEVPPFPFEEVRAIIEMDLKRPIDEIFETLDPVPVAAASIAQVHRATLKTGEAVVVKIQRPNLPQVIGADLRILAGLARILEHRVPEIRQFRPLAIVEEFRRSLQRETDFIAEAGNMARYKTLFADEPGLHVPAPYFEWTSRRVLVMERVEGVKVTDRAALESLGVDLKSVVEIGMRVTLRSIFEFGFFHADPHPGNFFVRADGTIALLDYGMMGFLESRRIDEMLAFMVAVLTGDVDMVVNQLLDADLIGDDTDLRSMRSEMRGLLDRYQGASIGSVDVAGFLNEVIEVTVRHHVVLPADLLLVGKSIATMEGIGHEMYPDFKPLEAIRPYLTEIYVRRMLDAKRHSQALARSVLDGLALLKDAPFDLRRILRKVRRGEMSFVLRHGDQEARDSHHARGLNRLLFAGLFTVFFFGGLHLLDGSSESTVRFLAGLASEMFAAFFFMGMMVSLVRGDGR